MSTWTKPSVRIQKAVEQAEDVAGAPIEHALLGVAGAHVRGMNSHGGMNFGARRAGNWPRGNPRRRWKKPAPSRLPADREILHLLPQEFILDDQTGVHDPLGMMATRLEVRVHMVTAASSATQNVVTAVNRAGVHVDDTVFEPLACADSVLRADERELGVCLADLGAGSTSIIVFQEGAVAHTGSDSHWRRSFHQRSFRRTLHAGRRGGKNQAALWQRHRDADPGRK